MNLSALEHSLLKRLGTPGEICQATLVVLFQYWVMGEGGGDVEVI